MPRDSAPVVTRLFRATRRHLEGIEGLDGVQVFTGRDADWREAARLGRIEQGAHDAILRGFDPEAGGAIAPASGGGWLASYMTRGAGLDFVLLLHMADIPPAELEARLKLIEARAGWLLVAALTDRQAEDEARRLAAEIAGPLLLDAARARTLRRLEDQWIARLERAFRPDLAAVIRLSGGAPKLQGLSGGALVERPSDARDTLERIAGVADRHRAPLMVEEGEGSGIGEEIAIEIERLGARRAVLLPVEDGGRVSAVVLLLWEHPPFRPEPALLDGVAAALSETVAIQRRTHPGLIRRVVNWGGGLLIAIFGKSAWKLKLAIALIVGLIIAAALTPSSYQPSFPARIEAAERRIIAAPFDGVLAEADADTGQLRAAGEVLLAMEDTDLRLDLARLGARAQEIAAQAQTARARRDTAQVRLLEAQLAQVDTERRLLDRQIERARAVAESEVIVVGGEARRHVGSRVRQGEPLLEVADPDSIELIGFIDEGWIGDVASRVRGQALLAAYPERPIPARLIRVGADPEDRDGVNAFPVWFEVSPEADMRVLDGMRGIVRIEVEPQSVLMARTRGLRQWAARAAWRSGLGGSAP